MLVPNYLLDLLIVKLKKNSEIQLCIIERDYKNLNYWIVLFEKKNNNK